MTLPEARKLYRKARKQLMAQGCTDCCLLDHGAGSYSIEYKMPDGKTVVTRPL